MDAQTSLAAASTTHREIVEIRAVDSTGRSALISPSRFEVSHGDTLQLTLTLGPGLVEGAMFRSDRPITWKGGSSPSDCTIAQDEQQVRINETNGNSGKTETKYEFTIHLELRGETGSIVVNGDPTIINLPKQIDPPGDDPTRDAEL